MKYNGIVISDIHFGASDPELLKNELTNLFLYYLYNMKTISFIIITGDYFDHKIYLNEKTSDYAVAFMDKLVEISKKHKCPIRIIYGTESHEVNQYNIFSMYEMDTTIDFKVIHTVEEEELLKDLKVLYIPEEFIFSKKDYYKNYLDNNKKYNYIFGHGIINEIMVIASHSMQKEKTNDRKKVPVFTARELLESCKGQVYFGHYHINSNIKNKIFYTGSFSRWIFGEEEPKGFYHITYDIEKEKYTQKFIENYLSPKYITYTYGYNSSILESEEILLKELSIRDKQNSLEDNEHIRFIFNIPETHPNPEFIINILNERYRYSNNVKVQVTNGYIEKKKINNKRQINDILNEYSLIFDKSIKIEDKLFYYIKKKNNIEIPIEKIKLYLYRDREQTGV